MEDLELIGVYRIVAPSGSCYVGATAVSFSSRWNGHRKDFKLGISKCLGLRRAFAKYGVENMKFEILEVVSEAEAESVWMLEKSWWNKLRSEGVSIYNGEPTGTGSVHHTQETRDKISRALKLLERNSNPKPTVEKLCAYDDCGVVFLTTRDSQNFCSVACGAANSNTCRQLDFDRDLLYDLYWNQGFSRPKIMEMLGISVGGFQKLFARHGIPMRSRSQGAALVAKPAQLKTCLEETCGSAFKSRRASQKYCSRECADNNRHS